MNHSESSPQSSSSSAAVPARSGTGSASTTPSGLSQAQTERRIVELADARVASLEPTMLLLTDSSSEISRALTAALEPLDAELVRASSPDALEQLIDQDLAVVLLDVTTNSKRLLEAARAARARDAERATPIVFVVASDSELTLPLDEYEPGSVDVLYAPLDPAIVRAKVDVFLKLHRLRDVSALAEQLRSTNAQLRQTAATAQEAKTRAEEARRAKDQFLATMSHEIRTPINAILGYTQIIELGLAGAITPQQRGFLARLKTSSDHLLGLVNDVLDLSKIEAAQMRVARVPGWTGAAVASAIELSAGMAAARGVELVDARPGQAGEPYLGDEHRVRQILLNLLSNAIKFTEPNGRVVVDCSTESRTPAGLQLHGDGPWACVSVTDTGIGVASENHDRIFEPFHQVESGHTRSRGGTGLGLSISRKLAHLMDGDLTIRSSAGGGSSFTLWLPSGEGVEEAARKARQAQGSGTVRVRGLREIGQALRDEIQGIVRSYAARLRTDEETPRAAALRQPDLEDHAVTFVADIAQSLIIVHEAEAQAVELLKDATEIQKIIAERHGQRRQRQGWSEASVRRDFEVLREEVERVARARIRASDEDTEQALTVVRGLIERADDISCRAWREANQRGTIE